MSSNDNVNKISILRGPELELELLMDGTATLDATTQIVVDGVTYSPESFARRIQAELGPHKAVRNAKVLLAEAFAERKARTKVTKQFISDARSALQGALGSDNPKLAKFGLKNRKERSPETLEEKVSRFEKAKVTRAEKAPRDPTPDEAAKKPSP